MILFLLRDFFVPPCMTDLPPLVSDSDSEDSSLADTDFANDVPVSPCLFCLESFSEDLYFPHLRTHYFDWKFEGMDYYALVRVVNFLRKKQVKKIDKDGAIALMNEIKDCNELAKQGRDCWLKDDTLLIPVVENDPLLTWLDDEDWDEKEESKNAPELLQERVVELTRLLNRIAEEEKEPVKRIDRKPTRDDDGYFEGYGFSSIHKEMLQDVPRTSSYEEAMKLFARDKVVLDVGCGTGILSLFAAKYGATHVHGIEKAGIARVAQKIVEKNGFADKITLHHGILEQLDLPSNEVNLIVSEWMGYILLFESMLTSVIYARDHLLIQGGMIQPSRSRLFIVALNESTYNVHDVNFFANCYGFDFTSLLSYPGDEQYDKQAIIETVQSGHLCSTSACILDIEMLRVKDSDLDFTSSFSLIASQAAVLGGFVFYFDCLFENSSGVIHVTLDTSPYAPKTHWKQTVCKLKRSDFYNLKEGDVITGKITMKRPADHPRGYDIIIEFKVGSGNTLIYMYEMI